MSLLEQLVLRAMARAEGPQGHGVAQHIHRSDAVLPAVAYGATQQIGRSRLDTGKPTLPILVCFPAEPQDASCQKRHRDNVLKGRAVAVPADPGARRILRHHELFERVRRHFADLARYDGQWAQVVGDSRIRARLLARKDVFVSKGIDPAIAQVSAKFEWLERQLFNSPNQVLLLRRRENVCGVAKAGGQRRLSEQIAHHDSGRNWHSGLCEAQPGAVPAPRNADTACTTASGCSSNKKCPARCRSTTRTRSPTCSRSACPFPGGATSSSSP